MKMYQSKYMERKMDEGARMAIVTVNLPKKILKVIEKIRVWGLTPSRSEYVRNAVREAINVDLNFMDKVDAVIESEEPNIIRVPNGDGTYTIRKILRRIE